ncbi:hypothetical protein [Cellulosilyticum sp. I15G10I2]|uniref:hypothetical protein n=1 Tax=Cellulosilyticum sp. I15G10I2 TaxID=1892843 RepID=UPI001FA7F13E|nr:hypothetical protein [Cellulosilyticum sp. I15G10I2]
MQDTLDYFIQLLDGITTSEWEGLKDNMDKKMKTMPVGEGIKVAEAAEIMGKSAQFIRVGLQKGILPFGHAVQIGNGKYTYYISPKLFKEYVGNN